MAKSNDRGQADHPGAQDPPWGEVLAPDELKRRELNMEALAKAVGVSASYLRLVRQGKRSPSPEKARKLLEALGYQVEQDGGDDKPDLVVTDDRGRVMYLELKTRSPRPPIDERLDELVEGVKDVQAKLRAAEGQIFLPRQLTDLMNAFTAQDATPDVPAAETARTGEAAGTPLFSQHAIPVVGGLIGGASRRQVEALLKAVPDEDLAQVGAYLRALVERQARSSPKRRPRR